MASGAVVHVAVFTAGALLGGGIAAAVASRRREQQARLPVPVPAAPPVSAPAPVPALQVSPLGRPTFSDSQQVVVHPVLKYGHPGLSLFQLLVPLTFSIFFFLSARMQDPCRI